MQEEVAVVAGVKTGAARRHARRQRKQVVYLDEVLLPMLVNKGSRQTRCVLRGMGIGSKHYNRRMKKAAGRTTEARKIGAVITVPLIRRPEAGGKSTPGRKAKPGDEGGG